MAGPVCQSLQCRTSGRQSRGAWPVQIAAATRDSNRKRSALSGQGCPADRGRGCPGAAENSGCSSSQVSNGVPGRRVSRIRTRYRPAPAPRSGGRLDRLPDIVRRPAAAGAHPYPSACSTSGRLPATSARPPVLISGIGLAGDKQETLHLRCLRPVSAPAPPAAAGSAGWSPDGPSRQRLAGELGD